MIDSRVLISCFENMKRGILYSMVGGFLAGVGLTALYALLLLGLMFLTGGRGLGEMLALGVLGVGTAVSLLATLVGLGLLVWGFFFKFLRGADELASVKSQYSLPVTIMKLGFIGFLVLTLLSVLSLMLALAFLPLVLATLVTMLLSALFAVACIIGFIMFALYLYTEEREVLYLLAAITAILSLFLGGLALLIAMALLYVAFSKSIEKLSAPKPATT